MRLVTDLQNVAAVVAYTKGKATVRVENLGVMAILEEGTDKRPPLVRFEYAVGNKKVDAFAFESALSRFREKEI